MAALRNTAYPRLKSAPTPTELEQVYTTTEAECVLADQSTKGELAHFAFLVLLKTFQRLGYFVQMKHVPPMIVAHIAQSVGLTAVPPKLETYDQTGSRRRHIEIIRAYRGVKPYDGTALALMAQAMSTAAKTKKALADLINVGIEELIHHSYELPGFTTLKKEARRMRTQAHRSYYHQVLDALSLGTRQQIDTFFQSPAPGVTTPWNDLKGDPGSPSLTHLKELADRLTWLQTFDIDTTAVAFLPETIRMNFAEEAASLDAARLASMKPFKRYPLACCLFAVQYAQTMDDVTEMLLKRVKSMQTDAQEALDEYHRDHQHRTDTLVATLRDLVMGYHQPGTTEQRFEAIDGVLRDRSSAVLQDCEAHLTYAGNNYFPFLWTFYKSHRPTLFRLLRLITLKSASQDISIEAAIQHYLTLQALTEENVPITHPVLGDDGNLRQEPLDLTWIPLGWWQLVTGQRTRTTLPVLVNRRHFETCLITQVVADLKSGDLYVEAANRYADPRAQQISWEEYAADLERFGEQVNLPTDPTAFIDLQRSALTSTIREADQSFPSNEQVTIVDGWPVITRRKRLPRPKGIKELERLLDEQRTPRNILAALVDTDHWLQWTQYFGPLSGYDAKVDDPVVRYLTTVFCYGCHLGPSATARALGTLDRRQIAWIDQRHISEDFLDQANESIINAYHRFVLPLMWGSADRASMDGTKWELYEQNLLAERHIRYGGYGGIGLYLLSSTYIALVTNFIACGAYEGQFLLDLLEQNTSTIQPTTVHSDSHGQNEAIFGLAAFLGYTIMPRIRKWQDLKLYRPTPKTTYTHIDAIFTEESIDWVLIKTHLPDMFRMAMSIKAGRLTPSTVLRTFSAPSKNRIAQAFREWGRAKRTGFLIRYMMDPELRATIQRETNKSEQFNRFLKWISFGSAGVIRENNRAEQRKAVKYNLLVANAIIFFNTVTLTNDLRSLIRGGHYVDPACVAVFSPYGTQYLDRFGNYPLDPTDRPADLDYDTPVVSTPPSVNTELQPNETPSSSDTLEEGTTVCQGQLTFDPDRQLEMTHHGDSI